MDELTQLATALQSQLRTSGPSPQVSHIKAAILIARDAMGAREACRAIGLGDVHSRVKKLAERVAVLLASNTAVPMPPSPMPPSQEPPPQLETQPPPQPSQPPSHHQLEHIFGQFGFNVMAIRTDVDNLADELGLPPLQPVAVVPQTGIITPLAWSGVQRKIGG